MFIESLKKELNKYSWGYYYKINVHNPFYDVIFPNVRVTFYRNFHYNSVECSLEVINNKGCKANLETLLKVNNVDISDLYYENSSVKVEDYLKQYVQIIFQKLLHIIKGDFKDFEKINRFNVDFQLIVKKMGTSMIFDTEIYKKLEKGDESWKKDLENLTSSAKSPDFEE